MKSFEAKLRHYLQQFKQGEISGMNQPIDITDDITFLIYHWVDSQDDLRVQFHVDKKYPKCESDNLCEQSQLLCNYVQYINQIFKDEGYPEFNDPTFEEQDDIMGVKPYLYTSSLPNEI